VPRPVRAPRVGLIVVVRSSKSGCGIRLYVEKVEAHEQALWWLGQRWAQNMRMWDATDGAGPKMYVSTAFFASARSARPLSSACRILMTPASGGHRGSAGGAVLEDSDPNSVLAHVIFS